MCTCISALKYIGQPSLHRDECMYREYAEKRLVNTVLNATEVEGRYSRSYFETLHWILTRIVYLGSGISQILNDASE